MQCETQKSTPAGVMPGMTGNAMTGEEVRAGHVRKKAAIS